MRKNCLFITEMNQGMKKRITKFSLFIRETVTQSGNLIFSKVRAESCGVFLLKITRSKVFYKTINFVFDLSKFLEFLHIQNSSTFFIDIHCLLQLCGKT